MTRMQEYLIPTRFILTLGYFIVTVLALFHKDANIATGLAVTATESDKASADSVITAALVLTIICQFITMSALLFGWTIFHENVNTMQVICNFVGGVGVAWFVLDAWQYRLIWVFWVFCSFIPTLVEVIVILIMVVIRKGSYRSM